MMQRILVHYIFNKSWYSYHTTRRSMVNMPKPVLYGDEVSPPVRFVQMTASLLEIDLHFHKIDLFRSENKQEFYKKINPLQKVPALEVNNLRICDSHAIALYLCRTCPGQVLYPADADCSSIVDQMMFFNAGSLFPLDSRIFTEYFAGQQTLKPEDIETYYYLLDYLECQLMNHAWLAANELTLADLCCWTTVSSLQLLIPITGRHNNILCWLNKLHELPCFEINKRGLNNLRVQLDKYKQ